MVRRAQAKFPTWPTDPLHALADAALVKAVAAKNKKKVTYVTENTGIMKAGMVQTITLRQAAAEVLKAWRAVQCHRLREDK